MYVCVSQNYVKRLGNTIVCGGPILQASQRKDSEFRLCVDLTSFIMSKSYFRNVFLYITVMLLYLLYYVAVMFSDMSSCYIFLQITV